MENIPKQLSSEWAIKYDLKIPEGHEDKWHPTDFEFSWNQEEISESEFMSRCIVYMIRRL